MQGVHDRAPLDARLCVPHHGLTMVTSVRSDPVASSMAHLALLLNLEICLGSSCLGHIRLASQLSSLGLASTHTFLLKLGPNHANLQS